MNPQDLRYAETHEWVHLGDDNVATIGLTAHAIEALTDLVYMDLPTAGSDPKPMPPIKPPRFDANEARQRVSRLRGRRTPGERPGRNSCHSRYGRPS